MVQEQEEEEKKKEFAKQDLSATISSHTTRGKENLISGRTSRVKVEAGLREGTRDQSLAFLVIVDADGDDVSVLAVVSASVGALWSSSWLGSLQREVQRSNTCHHRVLVNAGSSILVLLMLSLEIIHSSSH